MLKLAELTRAYIEQRPAVKDCIAAQIINFSALTKRIIKDSKIEDKHFGAILAAMTRISRKLKPTKQTVTIQNLLKNSKLHLSTKVCRFIFDKHPAYDVAPLHLIQGRANITALFDEIHYDKIASKCASHILDAKKGLVEIAITGPKSSDASPGLVAHISALLSNKDINILTTLGSYTEDVFIIHKSDLPKALDILEKIMN